MNINEFHEEKAASIKFDQVGDTITGIIITEPELIPDSFNDGKKVLALTLATEDGERRLFARSQMLEALGKALIAAGCDSIDEGGEVTVTYAADRELRSGRTMKVYQCTYSPAPPMGTGTFGEVEVDPSWTAVSSA